MLLNAEAAFLLVIDMQERLLPVIDGGAEVERNCAILMQAARQLEMPTIVSEQYPRGLGSTVPALAELSNAEFLRPKVEFSCARDPELMTMIEGRARKQAILCGIESHICVLQTAMELKERGFEVSVAIDATGSRKALSKEIARDRMSAAGISVVTTEMVVFELARTAASPHFKVLSKLIQ